MRDLRATDLERRGQAPPYRRVYDDGPGTWGGGARVLSLQSSPPPRVILSVGAARLCAGGSGWPAADAQA